MRVKTITYKRTLKVGSHETRELEMTIKVDTCLSLAEQECSLLIATVERKIREAEALEPDPNDIPI